MRRDEAERLRIPILAKFIATVTAGLPPRIMGIGPTFAIPKLLEKTGISQDDVDLFEINEAFASMYVFCVEKLGLDVNKVNVNGGALARIEWRLTATRCHRPRPPAGLHRRSPVRDGPGGAPSPQAEGPRDQYVHRSRRAFARFAARADALQMGAAALSIAEY